MGKRAHTGAFRTLSPKHLDCYPRAFAGRHNIRTLDTIDQNNGVGRGTEGKRLAYKGADREQRLTARELGALHDGTQHQAPHPVPWKQPLRNAGHGTPSVWT